MGVIPGWRAAWKIAWKLLKGGISLFVHSSYRSGSGVTHSSSFKSRRFMATDARWIITTVLNTISAYQLYAYYRTNVLHCYRHLSVTSPPIRTNGAFARSWLRAMETMGAPGTSEKQKTYR